MLKVLMIDDEPFYYKLIQPIMLNNGYVLTYARTGTDGLASLATFQPDIIIIDVCMPDLTGFDVMQRLRNDPRYGHTPVIFVSGQNQLDDKLKAFELGAEDYLEKPFSPEELLARLAILARRSKTIKLVLESEPARKEAATMVAVHSLRGGTGCSSIALNLALAFRGIWQIPTLLVDMVLAAGQLSLMMDATPKSTWEDFYKITVDNIDDFVVDQMCNEYKTGLRYIAAPKSPMDSEAFPDDFWKVVVDRLYHQNDFIVVDTAHDFQDNTLQVLDRASYILLVITPEMASLRAAVSALDIYSKLGYPDTKVTVTLNNPYNFPGIKEAQIEKVLKREISFVIPNDSTEVFRALNFGEPFILKAPNSQASISIEDIAYDLSKDFLKNIPPASPSASWKRVQSRLAAKRPKK